MLLILACIVELPRPALQGDPDHDWDHDGVTERDGDCNDGYASVHPGADELCNDRDDDCDDVVDEDAIDELEWYVDDDDDGYGAGDGWPGCDQPAGWVGLRGDCDDENAEVNPDAEEICGDGLDNDCDASAEGCGWSGQVDLAEADLVLDGEAGDLQGFDLTTGDLDDDGELDLVLGRPARDDKDGQLVVLTGSDFDDELLVIDGSDSMVLAAQVAWSPDLTGDGASNVVASAGLYQTSSGSAWVLAAGDTTLEEAWAYTPEDPVHAGAGVATLGDWDGDGVGELAVGSDDYDGSALDEGAVMLFFGPLTPGARVTEADLVLEGLTPEHVGDIIAGVGDLDGDGRSELAVGAESHKETGKSTGAVFLFDDPTLRGTHTLDDVARSVIGDDGDLLGSAVADAGDVDADGYDDLVVGSMEGGFAALIFGPVANDARLDQAGVRITGTGQLGYRVHGGFDFDADGRSDVALGAPGPDGTLDGGSVFLLLGRSEWGGVEATQDADAQFLGEEEGARAGNAMTSGDVDDDTFDDLLIAAPYASQAGSDAGRVYLLYGGLGL